MKNIKFKILGLISLAVDASLTISIIIGAVIIGMYVADHGLASLVDLVWNGPGQ